jgi:CBS domain containing-hemolysin-like protein
VVWGNYKFEVLDVDSYRIDQVMVSRIVPLPVPAGAASAA